MTQALWQGTSAMPPRAASSAAPPAVHRPTAAVPAPRVAHPVFMRPAGPSHRSWPEWGILFAWLLTLWVGTTLSPAPWVQGIALFVHLGGIAAGLGAALMVEYVGLLWMAGKLPVSRVRETSRLLNVPAWLGMTALLMSGALLDLQLTHFITWVKMLAVLGAALNGVAVMRLDRQLERLDPDTAFDAMPLSLRAWCVGSGLFSQVCWWTAVIIGMLNTMSRHHG